VSLAAGQYVIIAKLEINNSNSADARPACTLSAGLDSDSALLGTSDGTTLDNTAVGTLTVTHGFTAGGTVTLGCDSGYAPAGTVTAERVKITAIRVGSLTNIGF